MSSFVTGLPSWWWVVVVVVVPFAMLAAFCLLLFVVALVEKTPVTQFADQPLSPGEVAELPAYMHAMGHAAAQYGLSHEGTYRHLKYPQCFCAYWLSPDRLILARVYAGTI